MSKKTFPNTFVPHIENEELTISHILFGLAHNIFQFEKLPTEVQAAVKEELIRLKQSEKRANKPKPKEPRRSKPNEAYEHFLEVSAPDEPSPNASDDVYMIGAGNTVDHELNNNTEKAYNSALKDGRYPLINHWISKTTNKVFIEICYPVSGITEQEVKQLLVDKNQEYGVALTKEGNARWIAGKPVDEDLTFLNTFAPHVLNRELPLGAIIRLLYSTALHHDMLPVPIQKAVDKEMERRILTGKNSVR